MESAHHNCHSTLSAVCLTFFSHQGLYPFFSFTKKEKHYEMKLTD